VAPLGKPGYIASVSPVHALLVTLLSASSLTLGGPDLADYVTAQEPKANAPAWRPEKASEVLLMVKVFYDGTDDLQAKFEHHYTNPTFGERHSSKGKLQAKKSSRSPGSSHGKMVWDQSDKADPDYYTDGKTLWMVEHDTRQVIKTSVSGASEVDAAVNLLFGGEKLLRDYDVKYADAKAAENYGDADHYVLHLRPKQTAKSQRYESMLLVVHATTGRVDGLAVRNTDGSTNHYRFSKVKTNVGLSDDRFVYERPRNYVETVE
jgi:outer membrane lipoprotein carrier protein